jgi:hypothetical protein
MFMIKRFHRMGGGWTIYEYEDLGDPYMIYGRVIASSLPWDDSAVATNKQMLSSDLLAGWADFVTL